MRPGRLRPGNDATVRRYIEAQESFNEAGASPPRKLESRSSY